MSEQLKAPEVIYCLFPYQSHWLSGAHHLATIASHDLVELQLQPLGWSELLFSGRDRQNIDSGLLI